MLLLEGGLGDVLFSSLVFVTEILVRRTSAFFNSAVTRNLEIDSVHLSSVTSSCESDGARSLLLAVEDCFLGFGLTERDDDERMGAAEPLGVAGGKGTPKIQ